MRLIYQIFPVPVERHIQYLLRYTVFPDLVKFRHFGQLFSNLQDFETTLAVFIPSVKPLCSSKWQNLPIYFE